MRHLTHLTRSASWLSLLVVSLAGCRASYVDRGAALYAERDYVGAAEVFERNEAQFGAASESEQARYALYRGITLQSLGDVQRANYWLNVAWGVCKREPGALDANERLTLARAIESSTAWASRVEQATRDGAGQSAQATAAR